MKVKLGDVCSKATSNIAQKDLAGRDGDYPIYGASGFIAKVDFYQQEKPYIAVVKDGAGVGRVMKLPAKTSVIGTMQYIIPNDNVDLSYLAYAMEYMNLSKYYTGATIPHIYFKDYRKEDLPLPPLEEQHKIAALLDKVSGLMAKRRQQLEALDELVKARFVEMFGDPEFNTKNLSVVPLNELCEIGSSKRIYQSEQSATGIPFLRISDLVTLMDTGELQANLYIPPNRYKELRLQGFVPNTGDILVTSRGTLGRCYIIKDTDVFYFQDGMISWLYKFSNEIEPVYIKYLFMMKGFRKQIDSLQAGSTVAYLSISMLKKLKIMLPPIELQTQFAAFVHSTDQTKSTIQTSLNQLETLKKSLMQDYFG